MKSLMKTQKSKGGFTLLEVALALIVLGMSLVVIYQIFSNTLISNEAISSKNTAQNDFYFIQKQLLKKAKLSEVEKGGNITTPDQLMWSWSTYITSTKILDLYKLTITIKTTDKPHIELNKTIYVLRPTWTSSTDRQRVMDQLMTKDEN